MPFYALLGLIDDTHDSRLAPNNELSVREVYAIETRYISGSEND